MDQSSPALDELLDGVEERLSNEPPSYAPGMTDRDLAALAWPEGPPNLSLKGFSATSWSDLDPEECEAAIETQLNRSDSDGGE
jgi:hypothetical protein